MGMFDDLIPNKAEKQQPIGDLAIGHFPAEPDVALEGKRPTSGMFDDLIPQAQVGLPPEVPTGPAPEKEERFGDSLRPYFGDRNPLAESYDTFIEPLTEVSSDRPVIDRVQDTLSFVGSVPSQMLRLPTPGQAIELVTGSTAARESEERFVENNPKLLKAIGAAGEVTAGLNPLGQGFRAPAVQPQAPKALQNSPQIKKQISDDIARSRQAAQDMNDLNVRPFGPAVAAAKHGDNSPGALTQTLQDKPGVGAPLQRRAKQFVNEMVEAQDNIRSGYGSSQTMQTAGGQVRGSLGNVRNSQRVDVQILDGAQLDSLAQTPPRMATYRDVQAAKYQRAERLLPEDKAKAQPVAKGEERVIGGLENTRGILRDIKRRYGLTINKAEAARASKSAKNTKNQLSLDNTPDFTNPRWTGSANVDRSLDAIAASDGRWRTGIEGMREIRSNIRRVLSSKADTEVNALAKGDLKRLYSAVSRDMDRMLTRLANSSEKAGKPDLANRYRSAMQAYKEADEFTARYAQKFEDVKTLFRVQSDEALAGAIRTAMQDGTKGNLQRLISLRKTVPKEAIDEMASALIVDLGRPTGRASGATQELGFTPSRFSSQWNSLSPAGKRVMFGHRPQLFESLNKFARVSQNIADYEALVNNSRSGVSNAVWMTIGAGGGLGLSQISPAAVLGVMTTLTAGWGASSFLASPAYVNWLTRTTSIMSNGGKPGIMAKQLQALKSIVKKDRDINPQMAQGLIQAVDQAFESQAAGDSQ